MRLRTRLLGINKFDLIYVNSIGSAEVLPYLTSEIPIVCHIHELTVGFRTLKPDSLRTQLANAPNLWIAASVAVRNALVAEGFSPDRIVVHYEMIDVARVIKAMPEAALLARMKEELGIPPTADIVMGSGTFEWRKGVDLFAQLASEIRRLSNREIHFVWIGGKKEGVDWVRLSSDLERIGQIPLHLVTETHDPYSWYALADVFALTSREDPFPLVVLEHAAMGHAVVTYQNGGIPELLTAAGDASGLGVVDYLDVGEMARRVIAFLEARELRDSAGEQLRDHVFRFHDSSSASSTLFDQLNTLVNSRILR